MRRLARILLNAVTVLSLILFVATVVLWVRSYFATDHLEFRDSLGTTYQFAAGQGTFYVAVLETTGPIPNPRSPAIAAYFLDQPSMTSGYIRSQWGMPYGYYTTGWFEGFRYVWLALTFAVTATAIAAFHAMLRRSAGTAAGVCHICGYDLRATPERCPECGTIPTR